MVTFQWGKKNPHKAVWFDMKAVSEFVQLKVTRIPACYPYPCLQSGRFCNVCFTVGEPVRQTVCLVSRSFPVCLVKVMVVVR